MYQDFFLIHCVELYISAFINTEGVPDVVENLLRTQQVLYDAGARNFLLIDAPTIHRTPAGKEDHEWRLVLYILTVLI